MNKTKNMGRQEMLDSLSVWRKSLRMLKRALRELKATTATENDLHI